MNKKILIACLTIVLMLTSINIVSALKNNIEKQSNTGDSPLFKIRTLFKIETEKATGETFEKTRDKIKTNYVMGELFLIPIALRDSKKTDDGILASHSNGGTCHTTCPSETCRPLCLISLILVHCDSVVNNLQKNSFTDLFLEL